MENPGDQPEGIYLDDEPVLFFFRLRSSSDPTSMDENISQYVTKSPLVVLDLKEVELFSPMLAGLVLVHSRMVARWGAGHRGVYLVNVSESSRRVLEISKLDSIFGILNDPIEALDLVPA